MPNPSRSLKKKHKPRKRSSTSSRPTSKPGSPILSDMSIVHALKLRKLLTHKRNDRINTTTIGFEIDKGKKHFPGLTVVLKRRYKQFRISNQKKTMLVPRGMKPNVHRRNPGCRGKTDRDHGTLVDEQLTAVVNNGLLHSIPRNATRVEYYTRCVELRVDGHKIDPCLVRLLMFFRFKMGWVPIASQVSLFSEDLKITTAVDLVCEDLQGKKFILVELKTSCDTEAYPYELPQLGHYMSNPLQTVPSSHKNHDMLQVLGMDLILDKAYKCKPDASYLVRIGSATIWAYLLGESSWEETNRQRFYQSLKNSGYRK